MEIAYIGYKYSKTTLQLSFYFSAAGIAIRGEIQTPQDLFQNNVDSRNLRIQAMRGIQRYMDIDPTYAGNWDLWVENEPHLQFEDIWQYTVTSRLHFSLHFHFIRMK